LVTALTVSNHHQSLNHRQHVDVRGVASLVVAESLLATGASFTEVTVTLDGAG